MKNWKDYVGFQEIPEGAETGLIFYIEAERTEGEYKVSIKKQAVTAELATCNEDQIGDLVEACMRLTFRQKCLPPWTGDKYKFEFSLDKRQGELFGHKFNYYVPNVTRRNLLETYETIQYARMANEIAQQTLRGAANHRYENYVFYSGTSQFDRPIHVFKFGDLYGIFKHPKMRDYGFYVI